MHQRFSIVMLLITQLFLQPTMAQDKATSDTPYLQITLIKTIPGQFTDHFTNSLEQVYALTPTGQLKKYNLADTTVLIYNDLKKYGKPSTLDISNPLRTIVFFKSSVTATILDRLLTLRNTIALRQFDFFNVACVANTYDNNLWIFDTRDLKLVKINDQGETLLSSTDLRNLGAELPQHPDMIFEYNQMLCLVDQHNGLYLFDRYGAYQNRIALNGAAFVGTCKAGILLRKGNNISLHSPNQPLNNQDFLLPQEVSTNAHLKIDNEILTVLNETGIDIYKIK